MWQELFNIFLVGQLSFFCPPNSRPAMPSFLCIQCTKPRPCMTVQCNAINQDSILSLSSCIWYHFNWGEHLASPTVMLRISNLSLAMYIQIVGWSPSFEPRLSGAKPGKRRKMALSRSELDRSGIQHALRVVSSQNIRTLRLFLVAQQEEELCCSGWNGGWSIRLAALREELRRSKVRLEPWSSGHYRLLSPPGQAWEVLCVALCGAGGPLFDPACVHYSHAYMYDSRATFPPNVNTAKLHWAGFVRFELRDRFPGTCRSGGRWLCVCVLLVLDVLDAVICVVTELASIGTGTRLVSAKVGEEKKCPNPRATTRNSNLIMIKR